MPGRASRGWRRPPSSPGAAWRSRSTSGRTTRGSSAPGIYLKENSLPLLEEVGAYDEVAASGVRIRAVRIADERNEIIVTRNTERERLITVQRSVLHSALRAAAERAGAKLITGAHRGGARPDGTLLLDGGIRSRRT